MNGGCAARKLATSAASLIAHQGSPGSLVKAARRVTKDGDTEVWARPLEDGSMAVGLFNTGDEEQPVRADWKALGIKGAFRVRDLWRQRDLGVFTGQFQSKVARHGVLMLKLSAAH